LLGNGNGSLQTAVNYPLASNAFPQYVATADVNGDGKLDLVVAEEGLACTAILIGIGNGTFQAPMVYQSGTNPISIAVADVNSDGAPDLTIANVASNTLTTLLNLGGTLTATASSANPSNPGQAVTFTTTVVASLRNAGL